MKYYKDYIEVEPKTVGKRKKFDNNIYVLDIETTSYIVFEGKVYPAKHYKDLTDKQKKMCKVGGFMYIWQLSVNDTVYYGRTYRELDEFLMMLDDKDVKKIIFVHNLSFEFQFLKGYFTFKEVQARKSRHVMRCEFEEFNIRLQCSYYMSNCALKSLPKVFGLDVEKMVGDLDYSLLRNCLTPLDEKELKYCENDCLVVYKYILRELETYERVDKIPMTSTGKVRKELKDLTKDDWAYKCKVSKIYNSEPEIYAMLCEVFAGGYTHANYIHSTRILENVDSYDETSAYPYVMVAYDHFPMSLFRKCYVKDIEDLRPWNCYLLKVRFTGLECKYFNTFISSSKCRHIKGGAYDNGRIISAKELEISVTDVDLKFICDTYKYTTIEFLECYYSVADYLPKPLVNFILDKYVAKTELKGVDGKELEYSKIKNLFNGIYGMTVTNMICDKVIYDNINGWDEEELTNEEIEEKLIKEKKKGFLVFRLGNICYIYC